MTFGDPTRRGGQASEKILLAGGGRFTYASADPTQERLFRRHAWESRISVGNDDTPRTTCTTRRTEQDRRDAPWGQCGVDGTGNADRRGTEDGSSVARTVRVHGGATRWRSAAAPSRVRRVRSTGIALVTVLALTACTDDGPRDADGTVVTAGSVPVLELRSGDCLTPAPELTGEVAELPVVPCDEPHTQEVFGVVPHPEDSYPGAAAVAAWADGACLTELEDTLDLTLDDGVFVSYLLPTFDGWNTDDDREVICVLVFPGQDGVTGSFVAGTADITRLEPLPPVTDDGGGDDDVGDDDGSSDA